MLRALVAEFPDDFIFKGGTSLSKGYGIVERFSEDIDVLVLPGGRGRGSVDKLTQAMGAAAARGVSGEAVSTEAETGRHRAYSVSYPAARRPTELIATSVLFEASVRGARTLTSRCSSGHSSVTSSATRGLTLASSTISLRSKCRCLPRPHPAGEARPHPRTGTQAQRRRPSSTTGPKRPALLRRVPAPRRWPSPRPAARPCTGHGGHRQHR